MLGRHTSPQVVYAYLLVSSYAPDPSEASDIGSECATKFFKKERRQSAPSDEWYRHGRRMFARKRKQRSDKGEKRAKADCWIASPQNSAQTGARRGKREHGAGGGRRWHPIFDQLSPRRHEKKRVDRDDA